MIKTDAQLAADSLVVKNETIANANTALRVGTLLADLADSKVNVIGGLFASLSTNTWDFTTGIKKSKPLTANTAITITGNVAGQSVAILAVTQDATGSRTLSIGGTAITINTAANSVTLVVVVDLGGGLFAFDTNLGVGIGTGGGTPTAEAVVWADFLNTVADAAAGTLNGLNATTPAGARATKKLAANGYVEFNIGTSANSGAVVLILSHINDTQYTYNGSVPNKAAIYHYLNDIKKDINGGNVGTVIGALGTYTWLRLERSGNDIIYKASADGVTYTTLSTDVGLVTGVTDLFVKASFAVNTASAKMVTTRGLLEAISNTETPITFGFLTGGLVISGTTITSATGTYNTNLARAATLKLTGNAYAAFDIVSSADVDTVFGLSITNANASYNGMDFFVWKASTGNYQTGFAGANIFDTTVAGLVGDRVRLIRTAGVVVAQYFRGGVWTTLPYNGTPTATTADLFFVIAANAPSKISNIAGFNLTTI